MGADCAKTRKFSEDGASGTNFYAPPSPYWPKTAENQLKFINRGPAVRVFTRAGPFADIRPFEIEQLVTPPPDLLARSLNDFFASVNYVTHLDQFLEPFKIRWAVHLGNVGLKVLVPPQNYTKAQDSGYLRSRRRIE